MSYEAGTAFVQVVPSFQGVVEAITEEASKWGDSAGEAFAKTFNTRVKADTSSAPLGPSDEDSTAQGSQSAGAFADGFRARIEAALRDLPTVTIDGDSSDADRKIADVRAELEELRDARIGIDVSDDEALAKVEAVKAELDELSAKSPSIRVQVDAASASAELAAIDAESDAVGGSLGGLGGDAESAGGGLGSLGSSAGSSGFAISSLLIPALAALVAMLIPIGGLAAGALAAFPSILAGGAAGLGALKLGLSGIGGAISAYSQQQNKAASSTAGAAGAASNQAEQAASNAASIRNAANTVETATEAVATAQVDAANSVHQAQEQLASSQEALATAQVDAANSVHQAQEQLASSEQSLEQAEYSEQQAQEALTQARIDAANAITNLNDQVADGALAIRQAQIDQATALDTLNKDKANPATTAAVLAQDQLTYDQSTQHLQDLQDQQAQLTQSQQQTAAAGVEGSQQVIQAQNALQQAQLGVGNAQQSVADNTASLAQAQTDAVQKVADAQQTVTDNTASLAQAQLDSVQKVDDAQRALTQALDDQQDTLNGIALAADGGGGGGGAAGSVNQFAQDMAGLTPAGQNFVNFVITQLLPSFNGLKAATQEALLPGLQAGLTAMLPLFQAIQPFIVQAASGIGQFAAQIGTFLGSAQGISLISQIFQNGAGFMQLMAQAAEVLLPALLTISAQAGPIVNVMGQGILHMVQAFANWVSGGGFEKFLQWLEADGPGIVKNVADFVTAMGKLIVVAAPIGEILLEIVGIFSRLYIAMVQAGAVPAQILTSWKTVWEGIKTDASVAWQFIDGTLFQPLVDFFTQTIPNIFDTAVGWFQGLPGRIVTAVGDLAGDVWGLLARAASWFDSNVWDPVKGWFIGLPNYIGQAVGDIGRDLWGILVKTAQWFDANVWSPVAGWFIGLPNYIGTAAGNIVGALWGQLVKDASWFDANIWAPIDNWFTSLPGKIATDAKGMWDGVANAFIDAINAVVNVWDNFKFPSIDTHIPGIGVVGGFGLPHIDLLGQIATRATGGPVEPNTPYLVGEKGPELRVFDKPGYIAPNNLLGSLGSFQPQPPGPVVSIGSAQFADAVDVSAVLQQAAFFRRAKRL